jgi:hypothetical protein
VSFLDWQAKVVIRIPLKFKHSPTTMPFIKFSAGRTRPSGVSVIADFGFGLLLARPTVQYPAYSLQAFFLQDLLSNNHKTHLMITKTFLKTAKIKKESILITNLSDHNCIKLSNRKDSYLTCEAR